MSESLHLAELLCARLCHDLSGLLGSLLGVIEIAREEQAESETLAVAEAIAVELATRLKLLRAAWGQEGAPLDLATLGTFANSLAGSRHVQLDLAGLEPKAVFPPPAARVMLNVLLLATESLPSGGVVALSGSPTAHILVTLAGPRAAWPAGFAACLADAATAQAALDDVRSMQAPLTALIAREHGFRLSLLMPAGPTADAAALAPLLVSFSGR